MAKEMSFNKCCLIDAKVGKKNHKTVRVVVS